MKSITEEVVLSIGHKAQPRIKIYSVRQSQIQQKLRPQQKPMQLAKPWVYTLYGFLRNLGSLEFEFHVPCTVKASFDSASYM